MEIPKLTYIEIVDFTLKSMLELAKQDKSYILRMDLEYYYVNKIRTDNIITFEEFNELCENNGIAPLRNTKNEV